MRCFLAEAAANLAGVTEVWLAVHVAGSLWYRTDQGAGWTSDADPPYAGVRLAPDHCQAYPGSDGTTWVAIGVGEGSMRGAVAVLMGFRPGLSSAHGNIAHLIPSTVESVRAGLPASLRLGGLAGWLSADHPWLPAVRCLVDAMGVVVQGLGHGRDWTGRTIYPLLGPEGASHVAAAFASGARGEDKKPLQVSLAAGPGSLARPRAELLPCPEDAGHWLLTMCDHAGETSSHAHRTDLDRCLGRRVLETGLHAAVVPVVAIDLDQFAQVNDWLGYGAGDQILAEVERRLSMVAGYGACARLGGDEFACILAPCASLPLALQQARSLLHVFSLPIEVGGETLRLTASAGVSLYPTHATRFESLLLGAASALRRAKRRGKNRIEMLGRSASGDRGERGRIASKLRARLDQNEFRLRFQPQVSFDGTLVGFEALAEWQHPEFGVIPPDRFIPVAEECGRISELGAVLLSIAASQAAQWRQRYGFGGRLAVNISALQFDRPDFADRVAAAMQRSQLPGQCLELEITETMLISDIELAQQACARLRGIGVSICLDDFGIGFASLRLVQDLPLDALKLDRSFVRDLVCSPGAFSLVESVVQLAHGRGLRLVAEGVETPEELQCLAQTDCDTVQGYLISPPLDAEAAARLLAEHRHWGNLRAGRGHTAGG